MLKPEQIQAIIEICGCTYAGTNGISYDGIGDSENVIKLDQITSVLNCTSRTMTHSEGFIILITPHLDPTN